ncbi:hypothetical protein K505DRAFT_72546 [Melanomma pulvis-pyrius CBS 109.77]|uniref:Uncharacterized protein n=1 Tax=Melanomma pulvis-pyrius CBS 109.77 TaxID=1314802 RepID=A0A6A6X4I1_9PLEO|nr:hypothetical protein K505DRAFT_72546 [Melanomma pulvis-pyrius CBS 109.77]
MYDSNKEHLTVQLSASTRPASCLSSASASTPEPRRINRLHKTFRLSPCAPESREWWMNAPPHSALPCHARQQWLAHLINAPLSCQLGEETARQSTIDTEMRAVSIGAGGQSIRQGARPSMNGVGNRNVPACELQMQDAAQVRSDASRRLRR